MDLHFLFALKSVKKYRETKLFFLYRHQARVQAAGVSRDVRALGRIGIMSLSVSFLELSLSGVVTT